MLQVKIFETGFSSTEQESSINEWLKTERENIKEIVSIDSKVLVDYYQSGLICNQWVNITIVYSIKD
jgi:hypothetical protein